MALQRYTLFQHLSSKHHQNFFNDLRATHLTVTVFAQTRKARLLLSFMSHKSTTLTKPDISVSSNIDKKFNFHIKDNQLVSTKRTQHTIFKHQNQKFIILAMSVTDTTILLTAQKNT